jgi:hypothetical protein
MTRDNLIPEAQLASVVTALYADAHLQNWTHLPLAERSRAYSAWVENEDIGGVLTKYMTPEATRAWIKDGPMKEYARAIRGAGRYARFGHTGGTTTEDIIRAALGDEWSLAPNSSGVKPFHADAIGPTGDVVFIAWDESRNFKNLIWASLKASVERGVAGHVIVTEPPGTTTPRDIAEAQRAIAARCSLSLHFVREQLGSAAL